jgi:hypothetical protein
VLSRRLALSDALAIVVFATIGQLSHDGGVSAGGYARDALPVLVAWFAAAALLGTYRKPDRRTFLLTWGLGVTVAVAARALILGRHLGGKELAFLVTSLIFILLFTLAARGLSGLVAARR